MTEQRVRIEPDFRVEHEQLAIGRHCERVDFDLRRIGAEEGVVELCRNIGRLLCEIARQPKGCGHAASVMRHEAGRGINVDRVNLFRRVMRHGFNVHTALGRDHHADPPSRAIDEQREVEFTCNINAVGHIEPVDLLAGLPRLHGDERVAEHIGGGSTHVVRRPGEPHTALGLRRQFNKLALAAPAGVNLRLHDIERPRQLRRRCHRLVDAHRRKARRHRHTEFRQQFLGLIFVNVHGAGPFASLEDLLLP